MLHARRSLVRESKSQTPRSNEIDDEDKQYLALVHNTVPGTRRVCELSQTFLCLFGQRDRDPSGLDRWVHTAKASGIWEIKSFAKGLLQDRQTIEAAITEPW